MTDIPTVLAGPDVTGRGRSLNPFVVVDGAAGLITFCEEVFGAREVPEARTATPAGSLIHAEVRLGDSFLLLADRQDGWQARPGLLQVWVSSVDDVLARAVERGGQVVTPPSPFYGELTLARMADPWGNLWWLYASAPGQADPAPHWAGGSDVVFRTLDEHLRTPAAP
ncbi:VOC family protein [Isoptericola sp. F-RaC21]|uniref:VOC family protein n=1 Tax=Isoptericola sp. F-RaC21 TaxID=3141452 RepID=UPI00315B80E1